METRTETQAWKHAHTQRSNSSHIQIRARGVGGGRPRQEGLGMVNRPAPIIKNTFIHVEDADEVLMRSDAARRFKDVTGVRCNMAKVVSFLCCK